MACLADQRAGSSGRRSQLPGESDTVIAKIRAALIWQRQLGVTLRRKRIQAIAVSRANSHLVMLKSTKQPSATIAKAKVHHDALVCVKRTAFISWMHKKLRFSYRAGNSKSEKSPPAHLCNKWSAIAAAQLARLRLKHSGISTLSTLNSDESSLQFALRFTRTWHPVGTAMAVENISGGDKRCLTVTPTITASGSQLPVQVLNSGVQAQQFTDKMTGSLNDGQLAAAQRTLRFHVSEGKKHWQTSNTFKKFVLDIILPHLERLKVVDPNAQIAWVIDCASTHRSEEFKQFLRHYKDIHVLYVPPNMTHLAQPLDLNYQRAFKSSVRTQVADWVDSFTPEEGSMSVDEAKKFMRDKFKTSSILPKVIGEFLPTTFAELSTKTTHKGDELSIQAAWRKSPYWCALHRFDRSKWDKQYTGSGELGDMMTAAMDDPEGFLESHDASSSSYFLDQVKRGKSTLAKDISALFPPAGTPIFDVSCAPRQDLEAACAKAGMSTKGTDRTLQTKLRSFFDSNLILEERLSLFPVQRLRNVCNHCGLVFVSQAAPRSECVAALVDALTEDPSLAGHPIHFAEASSGDADDAEDSCMLMIEHSVSEVPQQGEQDEESEESEADDGDPESD